MNNSDIEIVAEKFKIRFSNFLITELEKVMVFNFYRKRYINDVTGIIVVTLGTREFDLIQSFFKERLFSKQSINIRILKGHDFSYERIDIVRNNNKVYYRGIKKLVENLSSISNEQLVCTLSHKYSHIDLDPIIVNSFVNYVSSLKGEISDDLFRDLNEEILRPYFINSSDMFCTSYISLKLEQLF
jgi:hypothetical protein